MRLGLKSVAAAICRTDKPSSCADLIAHIRSSWASSNRRSAVRRRSTIPRSRWMRLRNSSRVSRGAMVRHAVQKTGQLKPVPRSVAPQPRATMHAPGATQFPMEIVSSPNVPGQRSLFTRPHPSTVQIAVRLRPGAACQIIAVEPKRYMMRCFGACKLRQVRRVQNQQERSMAVHI